MEPEVVSIAKSHFPYLSYAQIRIDGFKILSRIMLGLCWQIPPSAPRWRATVRGQVTTNDWIASSPGDKEPSHTDWQRVRPIIHTSPSLSDAVRSSEIRSWEPRSAPTICDSPKVGDITCESTAAEMRAPNLFSVLSVLPRSDARVVDYPNFLTTAVRSWFVSRRRLPPRPQIE